MGRPRRLLTRLDTDPVRYGIVLGLLVVAVMVTITAPEASWSAVLITAIQGACLVVALPRRRWRSVVMALLLTLVLAITAATAVVSTPVGKGIVNLMNAAVIVGLPVIIVVGVRRNLYVNMQTVLGAVCIYLVIGILFATLDAGWSRLSGHEFFTEVGAAAPSAYEYFSFITLCTVGYGDLTPTAGLPRALAVSEALLGQLYLVTVIALLVGNFGQARSSRDSRGKEMSSAGAAAGPAAAGTRDSF